MNKELTEIFESFNKSPLRFLKRNLSLIVILPALFGGLWQVIELSRMSFSFIRFFSVGQIIPDGLLILLFVLLFLSSGLILFHYWKKLDSDDSDDDEAPTPKKNNVIYSIILFILFLGNLVLIVYSNNYFISKIESILALFFYLPVNIILCVISLLLIHYSILFCKDIEILHHFRKGLKNMRFIGFYVQSIMIISFAVHFHEVFMLPINLRNVDNLNCKMERVDNETNFEILYSNDKYIFVECYKPTRDRNGKRKQSEIRIFRFDDLLNDSLCVGSKKMKEQRIKVMFQIRCFAQKAL